MAYKTGEHIRVVAYWSAADIRIEPCDKRLRRRLYKRIGEPYAIIPDHKAMDFLATEVPSRYRVTLQEGGVVRWNVALPMLVEWYQQTADSFGGIPW